MTEPSKPALAIRVAGALRTPVTRTLAEETPVALVYDGSTYAVMMASPSDLEDFALGFSLTEGIIAAASEIERLETIEQEAGIELRMWLAPGSGRALAERRRRLTGPVGCGLCGIESLEAAGRPSPRVPDGRSFAAADIAAAMASLGPAQVLNLATRAVHAAAFWTPAQGLAALTEDVGRHNALDKLAGRMSRLDLQAGEGIVVLTSRISVEMVQKAAMMGAPVVAAVSAPTALAVRTAEEAGLTLVAVARPDSYEIFTHPRRIAAPPANEHQSRIAHDAA